MKHLKRITQTTPAQANGLEDILCTMVRAVNAFFTLLGADEPLFQFWGEKCSFTSGDGI